MIFQGKKYDLATLGVVFTGATTLLTVLLAFFEGQTREQAVSFFLNIEGVVLILSTFFNTLLNPPKSGAHVLEWLLVPSRQTISVICRQPVLYTGLICLFAGDIVQMSS